MNSYITVKQENHFSPILLSIPHSGIEIPEGIQVRINPKAKRISKKHKHLWHEPVSIQLVGQLAWSQNSLTPGFVKGFRAKRPLTKEEGVELQ